MSKSHTAVKKKMKTPSQLRQRVVNLFKGKTIDRIDAKCVNMWTIYFMDGTFLSIEVEPVFPSRSIDIFGLVPNLNDRAGQYEEPKIVG